MKQQSSESHPANPANYHFFFFINTKSGYGEGRQYFNHGSKEFKFTYQSNRVAFIYLADLFLQNDVRRLLQRIKKDASLASPKLRVIISGGDGTILWVVHKLINVGVDPNSIVFGINPIGTGNDFSRSIGWGFQPLIKTELNFKQQLAHQVFIWMNASLCQYDLWDVELQTYPEGQIYDIKNQIQIRIDEQKIHKIFCNYVGMGLDARVVYTVEKKRTRNAFVNKIIYGCVGFCNFFRSLKKLDKLSFVSESVTELSQQLNSKKYQEQSILRQTDSSDLQQIMTDVGTVKLEKINTKDNETVYKLKKGYRGLVCLNCPSYMCGLAHVWTTKKIAEENSKDSYFKPQKFDDGEVEFVAYKNELDLALERIVRSGAKLAQGKGPFRLMLQKPTKAQDIDNYIQIDGQSIKVTYLKQIRIQKTQKVAGSKLNVMFKDSVD